MPEIQVLPHAEQCPGGTSVVALAGVTLLDNLLRVGLPVPHACERSVACATCRIEIVAGLAALAQASEEERRLLRRPLCNMPGLRLACQATMPDSDLVIRLL